MNLKEKPIVLIKPLVKHGNSSAFVITVENKQIYDLKEGELYEIEIRKGNGNN